MSNFVTRKIPVRGTEVTVMEAGSGDPLVLFHGAGMARVWLDAYDHLAESFHLIVPHHPGFGDSPDIPGVDTVEDLAYYYDDLLTRLGHERFFLAGISFGGWIAAELAVLSPHRLDGLILIDSTGLRVEGAPITDTFMLNPERLPEVLFHDQDIAARIFPQDPDLDTLVDMYRDEASLAKFIWVPFCHNPKLAGRLHRVDCETLVLWAEHDKLVPMAHGERYVELLPKARLAVVENCGHAVYMEKPDDFARKITHFINEVRAPAVAA